MTLFHCGLLFLAVIATCSIFGEADRLPATILPEHYHLKIITYLENPTNLTFEGQVKISFQVLEDTKNITLHVQNLTVNESGIMLKSKNDNSIQLCLDSVKSFEENDFYILMLCQTLKEEESFELTLDFSGVLGDLVGYYRSSYNDDNTNETRWLSATKFEPGHAREAFPCLDEPNYKANFTIWLGHHKTMKALSNMPLEKQVPLDNMPDFVWSIFEESPPMSTYLVAYTINDFNYKEIIVGSSNITLRTWGNPNYEDEMDYATEMAANVLKYYEDLLGPFPLKKLDQIAIPDFYRGGMENWGLITYRESALLHDHNDTSAWMKYDTARLICHEVAHQWFGDLVTMKWWNDLWLNEGFATYIAIWGVQHILPEFEAYEIDSLLFLISAFERDAKLDSHPVSPQIFNTTQIASHFDSISYRKGASILKMLHMLMGHEAFFEVIRNYLERFKFRNAEKDDLWLIFNEVAHKYKRIETHYNLKTIMDSWTLQAGFPLVTVKRNLQTGCMEIAQQRFLENSTIVESEEYQKCWWVPLGFTISSELNFNNTSPRIWLECDEANKMLPLEVCNVTKTHEWIIFNIQLSGIYRVMYDPISWQLISEALKSPNFEEIHILNRGQIINDVLTLAWSGYQQYDIALDIMEYLHQEREYLPWSLVFRYFADINSMMEPYPQHYELFRKFLRYIVGPVYGHFGGLNASNFFSGTKPFQNRLKYRANEWACRANVEDCVQRAIAYFNEWKLSQNPENSEENYIPQHLREDIHCTAIRHGSKDNWLFLWQRFEQTQDYAFLDALACSTNESIINNYLDFIFDPVNQLSNHTITHAFKAIAESEIGSHLARQYLIDNSERLCNEYPITQLVTALVTRIRTREQLQQLEDTGKMMKIQCKKKVILLPKALETINFNIQWIERNLDIIKMHLQRSLPKLGII
ncbi:aminopeptidase N-like [Musca autumnalis]|uniref:aminopeptidase N-like n=1 Tax=Musca autumnalis TaxID=221902 RepID=UPI003CF5C056